MDCRGQQRTTVDTVDDFDGPLYWSWSPNQVVAYNLARAREDRGWTQEEAGQRLEPHLGVSWSKATFSQAERSVDPGKSRGFTADEIVAFSRCFDLPVAWFFLPPPPGTPGTPRRAETGDTARQYARKVNLLLAQIFGTAGHDAAFDRRLDAFAGELTTKGLAEAKELVAEAVGSKVMAEPTAAGELRRWREALESVAEGIAAIEGRMVQEVERQPERGIAASDGVDLRTVRLPSLERLAWQEQNRDPEHEIDLGP